MSEEEKGMDGSVGGAWAIGIDVGGTKIEAAQVEATGRIGRMIRRPTEAHKGARTVKANILSAIKDLLENPGSRPAGVGIGMAGQIDPQDGSVRFAPNLGWKDEPFQADLARELPVPVFVTNDVRAATWGEWKYGAGQGCEDLICLFVGTGIGGGAISGGRLLSGCSNSAGEFGHITISQGGRLCHCGNRGCLEALAGGRAIAEQAQEAVRQDPGAAAVLLEMSGGRAEGITAQIVAQACGAGEPLACRLMKQVGEALSAGVASLANALNPCRCLLGGGVIGGTPDLVRQVDEGVREKALPTAAKVLQILPAQLGDLAGVAGAASLAMTRFK
jgi:glucokinase